MELKNTEACDFSEASLSSYVLMDWMANSLRNSIFFPDDGSSNMLGKLEA
jgi:hypothetical protein